MGDEVTQRIVRALRKEAEGKLEGMGCVGERSFAAVDLAARDLELPGPDEGAVDAGKLTCAPDEDDPTVRTGDAKAVVEAPR